MMITGSGIASYGENAQTEKITNDFMNENEKASEFGQDKLNKLQIDEFLSNLQECYDKYSFLRMIAGKTKAQPGDIQNNNRRRIHMKKLFAVLIFIALIISIQSISAAEEIYDRRNGLMLFYSVLDDGTLEIVHMAPTHDEIDKVIPSEWNGIPVTSINSEDYLISGADWDNERVSITIPNSIVTLKGNPFYCNFGAPPMEFHVAPDHPTLEVVNGCLMDKTEKKLISASASFSGIPEGTRILGKNCCLPYYPTLEIPESVITIESGTYCGFSDTPNCTITIPKNVINIEGNPFFRVNVRQATISVEKGHPVFAIIDGMLIDQSGHRVIQAVQSKGKYTIPDGMETIEEGAFNGENMSAVKLPDSIKHIRKQAFWCCHNLKTINLPEGIESIEYGVFDLAGLQSVKLPSTIKTIGEYSFENNEMKAIELPEGLESIGDLAFANCNNLQSITIPDSVESLGEWAFSGCKNLKEVVLGKGIRELGKNTFIDGIFGNCSKLESVTIRGSINEIPRFITLMPIILKIDQDKGCNNLKKVIIETGPTMIPDFAFKEMAKLEQIVLPDTTEFIGREAFSECVKLKSVSIPGSVKQIGKNAFSNCKQLKEVTLEEGVKMIMEGAFSDCISLESMTIPGSVEFIAEGLFTGCKKLKSVVFEEGVAEIRNKVFENCLNLKTVKIPDSVTEINCTFDQKKVTLIVGPGSVAEQYCIDNGIKYTYR